MLNKVMLIGNLGNDPEAKKLEQGQLVTFRLATNYKEKTEWHNVVCFDKVAESTSYLSRGRKVFVEGRLQTRTWDDDKGQRHYKTEVVAQRIIFLDHAKDYDNLQEDAGVPAEDDSSAMPF
jgi:single-strand DNA-binding protein